MSSDGAVNGVVGLQHDDVLHFHPQRRVIHPSQEWPGMPAVVRGRTEHEATALLLAELLEGHTSIAHDVNRRAGEVFLDLPDLMDHRSRGVEDVKVETVSLGVVYGFRRHVTSGFLRGGPCGRGRSRRSLPRCGGGLNFRLGTFSVPLWREDLFVYKRDREHARGEAAREVDVGLVALLLGTVHVWRPALPILLQGRTGHHEILQKTLENLDLPLEPWFQVQFPIFHLGCGVEAEMDLHVHCDDFVLILVILVELVQSTPLTALHVNLEVCGEGFPTLQHVG
mmetsp:Transcript_79346/g.164730  ORF Transcript_79346/g.164730 Transcript_79346/m.164730 type:complete len:282 (+) Transcript_79346:667-1512(+)